jgi:hypothetical protein
MTIEHKDKIFCIDVCQIFNENCVRAGEVCNDEEINNDCIGFTIEDVPEAYRFLAKCKPKNASQLFRCKVCASIIKYFHGEIKNLRLWYHY